MHAPLLRVGPAAPVTVAEPYKGTDEEELWATLVSKHDVALGEEDLTLIDKLWQSYTNMEWRQVDYSDFIPKGGDGR